MTKLTLRKKIELIEYHEKTGGTLLSVARKYNVTITTVHNILKNKSEIVKRYNGVKNGRARRFSLSEHAVMDFEVGKWYSEQQGGKQFSGVTKWDLRRIVNSVAKEYKIDFKITSEWFKEFVKKNGVVLKVVSRKSDESNLSKDNGCSKKRGHLEKGIVNVPLKDDKCDKYRFKRLAVDSSGGDTKNKTNIDPTVESDIYSKHTALKELSTSEILLSQENIKTANNLCNKTSEKIVTNTDHTVEHINNTVTVSGAPKESPKLVEGMIRPSSLKKDKSHTQRFSHFRERVDNFKNNLKEYHFQKVGRPCIGIKAKKLQAAKKFLFNVNGITRRTERNLKIQNNTRVTKIKNKVGHPKKVQGGKQAISNLSNTQNGLRTVTDAVKVVENNFQAVRDTKYVLKIGHIKKNNVGRTKKFELHPKNSPSTTPDVANPGGDSVKDADNILKFIDDVRTSPKEYNVHKNKVGRPRKNQASTEASACAEDSSVTNRNDEINSISSQKKNANATKVLADVSDSVTNGNIKLEPLDGIDCCPKLVLNKSKPGRPKSIGLKPKKQGPEQDLSNISNVKQVANGSISTSDNTKKTPVTNQLYKNKVHLRSMKAPYINPFATQVVFIPGENHNTSNSKNVLSKAGQLARKRVDRPKKVQRGKHLISNLSNTQNGPRTVTDSVKGVENNFQAARHAKDRLKIGHIKKNNLGRPKKFELHPKNNPSTTPVVANPGGDSDPDNILKPIEYVCTSPKEYHIHKKKVGRPRKNQSSTEASDCVKDSSVTNKNNEINSISSSEKKNTTARQVLADLNDSVASVNIKLEPPDGIDYCPKLAINKNKPGRPKSIGLKPKKQGPEQDLSNISNVKQVANGSISTSDNTKKTPVTNQLNENKISLRSMKAPYINPFATQAVFIPGENHNTSISKDVLSKADQLGRKRVGRPKSTGVKPKVTKKVSKNSQVLKVLKNNLKPSLKLRITRVTLKENANRDCNKRKDASNRKSDNLINSVENGVFINNNATNEAGSKNNNYKISFADDSINNNNQITSEKQDVFDFNIDIEDATFLPLKRQKNIYKTNSRTSKFKSRLQRTKVRLSEICHLKIEKKSPKKHEKLKNILNGPNDHASIVHNANIAEFAQDMYISSKNVEIISPLYNFNLNENTNVKPGFEQIASLDLTPKKPRLKRSSLLSASIEDSVFHRGRRRSTRINNENNTSSDVSEKKLKYLQTTKKRISGSLKGTSGLNGLPNGSYKDPDVSCSKVASSVDAHENVTNLEPKEIDKSFPNNNGGGELDLTDYCVAVEHGNIVEIACIDQSKKLLEEVNVKAQKVYSEAKLCSSRIDIISDIKISSASRSTIKSRELISNYSNQSCDASTNNATEYAEEMYQLPSPGTTPTDQSYHPLDDSWSNLFSELESDLSADELVTKINEIDFQYDSDPFKDVKILVHSEYEDEEQETDVIDYDAPSSQSQSMPPPNQMQQPPNNMQNGYRPPMPPNRAPGPRGPQPGVPRMPGGPRGPQMNNQRAPGVRPRAPMVRPRGAGAQPIRGQMRPRMTGPQNGVRPSTSPVKRTPEQNNSMMAKRKKLDVLTPSDKDDDDCQVICMQPKNTDGGLPQIESVQGAESVENSIMHLSDSITLSVRNPPPKPVVSPVKSDAKAVANILATRGITVTASAKSKESNSPVKQAPSLPTALSLNGAVSIVASKNASAKPVAESLPTVDLTDDSMASSSQSKNRPGLPYRCDLCPAQYPNAMGLNKHRQTYHKTTSGMCELGVPLINIKQPGIMQKLSQMGINNYIPLPSAGPEGTYALPIISTKSPGNVAALGATQMLSLGPVRTIPRPGVPSNTNTVKK